MGDEIVSLELKNTLKCHPAYVYICITPKKYNSSEHTWENVKKHLSGLWHTTNISLDLISLQNEIQAIFNASPLSIDIAKQAESFLKQLTFHFPSVQDFA